MLGFVTHEGSSRLTPCPGLSTTAWLSHLQHPPQECTLRPLREGVLWAALCTGPVSGSLAAQRERWGAASGGVAWPPCHCLLSRL